MPTPKELKEKFWDKLKSDRTMMLGLDGVEDGHARPMTAQAEGEHGPIWFFTSVDNALVQKLSAGDANFHDRAIATFVDKGHDVFATVHGSLTVDTDRAVVDRLWNKFVAAWYEGGKDDPKLRLLRLDPESAEIWLNENSLFAGAKMLLGIDPKQDYMDKVATVRLS
jgi:general stress protein 26